MDKLITRYGSSKIDLLSTSAVIRARALALGINLRKTEPKDLAAASIGVDAWLLLSGAPSFVDLSLAELDQSLGAILARGAGYPMPQTISKSRPTSEIMLLRAGEEYYAWASSYNNIDPNEIISSVASDLARGDTKYSQFAAMLERLIAKY